MQLRFRLVLLWFSGLGSALKWGKTTEGFHAFQWRSQSHILDRFQESKIGGKQTGYKDIVIVLEGNSGGWNQPGGRRIKRKAQVPELLGNMAGLGNSWERRRSQGRLRSLSSDTDYRGRWQEDGHKECDCGRANLWCQCDIQLEMSNVHLILTPWEHSGLQVISMWVVVKTYDRMRWVTETLWIRRKFGGGWKIGKINVWEAGRRLWEKQEENQESVMSESQRSNISRGKV